MTKQILNLIADQLNVLIMINKSENHAVTFLSQSAEWLFGIKREVISCAEDLFKQLDLYEKYPEVQKFCRESVKYTIAFEHAFSMPGKPETVWIMVRMAPGEQGENILLIQDVTMLHRGPQRGQQNPERVRYCLQQIMVSYQGLLMLLNQKRADSSEIEMENETEKDSDE